MHARLIAALVSLALASTGFGLTLDGSGQVTDWNLTPDLANPTHQANVVTTGMVSTYANDYAPIDFPGGVGREPSPGLPGGEKWDQEQMHVRVNAQGLLQVLVVNSTGFSGVYKNETVYLGDLFITVNDQRYGVVTQSASQGLSAGDIYRIDRDADVEKLQDISASYINNNKLRANDYGPDDKIRNIAGPWAVDSGIDAAQLIGAAAIDAATFDYGGDEDGTHLIEYTMDLGLFGVPTSFQAHQTYGCGNDVIKVIADGTEIPEPASLALMSAGLLLIARRHRKA